jgi:hypothetical protein
VGTRFSGMENRKLASETGRAMAISPPDLLVWHQAGEEAFEEGLRRVRRPCADLRPREQLAGVGGAAGSLEERLGRCSIQGNPPPPMSRKSTLAPDSVTPMEFAEELLSVRRPGVAL